MAFAAVQRKYYKKTPIYIVEDHHEVSTVTSCDRRNTLRSWLCWYRVVDTQQHGTGYVYPHYCHCGVVIAKLVPRYFGAHNFCC